MCLTFLVSLEFICVNNDLVPTKIIYKVCVCVFIPVNICESEGQVTTLANVPQVLSAMLIDTV